MAAGLTAIAAATVIAVWAGGCGWSARDTHIAHQRVSIQAQQGDGSTRFSRIPDDPFKAQAGAIAVDTVPR